MPKKSPGGPRDAAISLRLPARVKFGLELLARRNAEPITDVIVRALSLSLSTEEIGLFIDLPGEELPVFLLPRVWDEREAVRTVKLALVYEPLLSGRERAIWKVVQRNDKYWERPAAKTKAREKDVEARRLQDLRVEVLEADWKALVDAATSLESRL